MKNASITKKHLWTLVVGLCLQSAPVFAQSIAADIQQLEDSLSHTRAALQRVEIMNEIAWLYRNDDLALGLQWAYQAGELAAEQSYTKGQGDSFQRQALLFFKMGYWDQAFEKAIQSVAFRKSVGEPKDLGNAYIMVGNIQVELGQYADANESYEKALEQFARTDTPLLAAQAYNGLGILHNRQNDKTKALLAYEKTLQLYAQERPPDTLKLSQGYRNIGAAYHGFGQLDSARFFFLQSKTLLDSFSYWEPFDEAATLLNLGIVELDEGRSRVALDQFFLPALKNGEEVSLDPLMPQLLSEMSRAYEEIGKSDSALQLTKNLRSLDEDLYGAERTNRSDFFNEVFQHQETRFALEAEKLRLFIAILGIGLLVILMVLLIWLSRQRENRIAAQLLGQLQQKDLKFLNQLMEGMEQERQRIAHDLHDNLLTLLGISSLNLNALENTIAHLTDEKALQQYQQVQENLNMAIDKTRDLSRSMEKGILKEMGLEGALTQLKDALETTGQYEVHLDCLGTEAIKGDKRELICFQFIRELVNNIVRHAQASQINLYVMADEKTLSVMVEDNGVGFVQGWKPNAEGIGILHIQTLVEQQGGHFLVESTSGKGATVSFSLPVESD